MIQWLSVPVYLHITPVDFRKSINGLSAIVDEAMGLSPFDAGVFVFCNRKRDKLKVLYWDKTGFALWYKRLEKDTFKWPRKVDDKILTLSDEQWDWLLRSLNSRFEPWVDDCPLTYTSPNAPKKKDVLGSLFLSILSGHNRYAHMTALLSDGVNSKLLVMSKVVSDDSARRALKKINEEEGVSWLQQHLHGCYEPLLKFPWILDCDVTVKPLYGKQEGAEIGYNQHKPGRPSHTLHTYMVANLRLVLDVEVQPGNQSNSKHSLPGLLDILNRLPESCRPKFVRGYTIKRN